MQEAVQTVLNECDHDGLVSELQSTLDEVAALRNELEVGNIGALLDT